MINLDVATVLLQWATGGLLFLWVTSRRRIVGIGYGWLLRSVYGVLAVGAVAAGTLGDPAPVRDAAAAGVALAALVALVVSIVRRKAGVAGEHVATSPETDDGNRRPAPVSVQGARGRGEFAPALDLFAPVIGTVGLVAGGLAAGGPDVLAVARTLVGALFLGAVSDAMLLGHWYLVQPGLPRAPLHELNRFLALVWPAEVALLLVPTGMLSVLSGSIDDGYGGMLGWFWVACAITTLVLCFVTKAALKERAYSAVMAATGLLYLAILTAFGTDLVARALLAQG
ncbi:MAG TPA: hypothetical protein VNB24_01020 [Acidimicrobiales bacterium]|nr:hypothetical protein [Acidimicrobiales bacterium]